MRKNAVVTGASYGLGAVIASQLMADGYHVYGLSRSKPANDFLMFPEDYTWIECDISNADEVKVAFKHISTYIDVLVNNAGVFEHGSFNEFTKKRLTRLLM